MGHHCKAESLHSQGSLLVEDIQSLVECHTRRKFVESFRFFFEKYFSIFSKTENLFLMKSGLSRKLCDHGKYLLELMLHMLIQVLVYVYFGFYEIHSEKHSSSAVHMSAVER